MRASAPPSNLPLLPPTPRAPQFRAPHRPGPAARSRAEAASDGDEGGKPRRRHGREIAHIWRPDAGADLVLPPSARWLFFYPIGIWHVRMRLDGFLVWCGVTGCDVFFFAGVRPAAPADKALGLRAAQRTDTLRHLQ